VRNTQRQNITALFKQTKLFPLHLSSQDGNGARYVKISNCKSDSTLETNHEKICLQFK